jgi:hypothetical protein
MSLNNKDKGELYEQYVSEANVLQRQISTLKSQYVVNVPEHIEKLIEENKQKITELEQKLNNLYK